MFAVRVISVDSLYTMEPGRVAVRGRSGAVERPHRMGQHHSSTLGLNDPSQAFQDQQFWTISIKSVDEDVPGVGPQLHSGENCHFDLFAECDQVRRTPERVMFGKDDSVQSAPTCLLGEAPCADAAVERLI
ncbi:MAG TPA: hypothetical protein PKD27_00060 [Tepidiformaceae bacterium]|nr:hypothetical protein [Tepidiformaceae bacterium]